MQRAVVVTGGNAGIGKALCKQLAAEDGCFVFLGARSLEKGSSAVKDIVAEAPAADGKLKVVQIDVADDASVTAAAATIKAELGETPLFALVNNAGTGFGMPGVTGQDVMEVNWKGPQRMVKAFLPLLGSTDARVVNLGSGAGPMFVKTKDVATQKFYSTVPESMEALEAAVNATTAKPGFMDDTGPQGTYGLSKAALSSWTMLLAKENPSVLFSCVSPGFIATNLTKQFNASKPPEEGTVSIRGCLFKPLAGNGWYYGSDGIRSPYHFVRNPGEPEYDGVPPS